ncbi:MAG TPA: GLPGLI family protein [Saprospiraceae bacterium]|nr:GLPGLI family protein [Saprospiraceae bacterium]
MKQILLALLALLAGDAIAQQTEGDIQFDEKMNMHRNLPPDAADVRAMMPEWRVSKAELLFLASESLFHNPPDEDEDEPAEGGPMVIKMQRPEAIFYRNYSSGRKVDSREFFGKVYLIDDSLATPGWKITGQTKTILGYNCLEATTQDTVRKRQITAWFTDAIALSSGPAGFGQLPGMILELDINNGELIFTATKVNFRKLKKNELAAPKKGEKISDADFQKMVAERMRENGGRPMRIIRN